MEKSSLRQIIRWILFLAYIAVLFYFLFFSEGYGRIEGTIGYRYNLIPFKEIKRFISYRNEIGIQSFFINIVGNILAFAPFGFLISIIIPRYNRFFRVLITGALFSIVIEVLQLVFKIGIFDIDDIFLNTLGTIIGFFCQKVYRFDRKALKRSRT